MQEIISAVMEWIWGLSPVVVLVGLGLVLVIAFWGRRIAFLLIKDTVGRKYALEAVRMAEGFVILLGSEKWMLALNYLNGIIKKRIGFAVPEALLKKWLDWALNELKRRGEEIKAGDVLETAKEDIRFDDRKLRLIKNGDGFEVKYQSQF